MPSLPKRIKVERAQTSYVHTKKMHTYLTQRGFKPRTHWLYNKAAQIMKDFDTKNDVTYQIVLPGMHRYNTEERCICTFKNHLVVGLSSTDNRFPLH